LRALVEPLPPALVHQPGQLGGLHVALAALAGERDAPGLLPAPQRVDADAERRRRADPDEVLHPAQHLTDARWLARHGRAGRHAAAHT